MLDRLNTYLRSRRAGLIANCTISGFDLVALVALLIGGLVFHWNYHRKYPEFAFFLGGYPYCDGYFWWNGAIHFSEGLLKYIPGLGMYRPGYWILTGCFIAVLGISFALFQKLLLITFLATCMVFYLSLRSFLTRAGALAAVALLTFNPDVAHWLSMGMTDGAGLILNVLALSCLFFGTDRRLSIAWLSAFGLLFSVSTFVRPIVSPFIGAVFLVILLLRTEPLKKRLYAIGALIATFCVPTLCLMVVQLSLSGNFSVSSNDASAIYASSDPKIQCWAVNMEERVLALGRKRLHKSEGDPINLNKEYWYQTRENYIHYFPYHLRRALPHLWEVAKLRSASGAAHKADGRRAILIALTLFLFFNGSPRRFWSAALFLLVIPIVLWIIPTTADAMVCAGCILAFVEAGRHRGVGGMLTALYWLTGVTALYLTGGTIGPPVAESFGLSYLGQRLILQVNFAGALLAVFLIDRGMRLANPEAGEYPGYAPCESAGRWGTFFHAPNRLGQRVVFTILSAVFISELLILLAGGCVVGYRAYGRYYCKTDNYGMKFPDVRPVLETLQRPPTPILLRSPETPPDYPSLLASLQKDKGGDKGDSGDVIMLGTGSSFVWNLYPQNRSLMVCYQEAFYSPFSMSPNVLLCNVPATLQPEKWHKLQGLFVFRNFKDKANDFVEGQSPWGPPYFRTAPELRAFIPLSKDGNSFDVDKICKFQLMKAATQLMVSGELSMKTGTIVEPDYKDYELQWRKSRHFVLQPDSSGIACLVIDASRATGNRSLGFSYKWNFKNVTHRTVHSDPAATVTAKNSAGNITKVLLGKSESYEGANQDRQLRTGSLDLSNPDISSLEIAFSGMPSGASIEINELNLVADDFR